MRCLARARLLVRGIEWERILLSGEPAQPERATGTPDGADSVAERDGQDGDPKGDVADDAQALRTELP
jgi:hypothetical protein